MIKYRTKLIEKLTHGRAVSHMLKTTGGMVKPPDVVTCFGSYKVHTRPLIDWNVDTPDGDWQTIKLYFTYSRNGGPIQRVMIDENTEDWDAIDLLYSKLDTDLCRAQDGESLAFYLLSDNMGLAEQVIPELNDIHLPPVLLPPIEVAQMTMASVPEQPDYDYTITGIGGDGLIPIPNVFNIDSRNISIPHPYGAIDPETVDWMAWPRWYPNNTIVKEDNTIVIYPSEGVEPHDFDLFSALGGVDNTPITINSCVKAVPRKYSCEASHVVGSQVRSLILARMALAESGVQSTAYREPIRFSDTPFPFKAAGWSGDPLSWPPYMPGESGTWGHDWVATYRRNDGPLKSITWNTGSLNPGSHHSVWDAIKELLLDDYGRTAFMLSDFNSTASSFNGDGDVTVKSGIRSNLNFTTKPPEEGEPLHRYIQPYRFSGKSVEVRDRQIQFSDVNAGAVWNENTITIYPTPWEVINDYGFDGQSDYYEYLCQYYDQLEAGEPITIHSCAAVEPADHIQVNTNITLNSPEEEEVPRMMGQGLSAAIKLNDGAVKHFKFEAHEVNVALNEILTYLYFMGKTPETTINQGDGTELKINDLYFRSNFTAHSSEISGCSGTERDQEFWMPVGNPMDYEDPNSTPRVSILETPEPYKRESNKATFIKHPVNGYTDLFDLIKYTSGDEHTIYSSAVVPSVIWDRIDDGEEPVDPEPNDGDLSGIEPFTFTNVSEPGTTGITKFDIGMSNTDGYWEIRESGQLIASPNHRANGVGFDSNRDDYKSIVIYNMDGVTRDFEVYVRASTVSVGIECLYIDPGEVELKVTSFGNVSPKMIFRVGNGIVYLPETFPPHITDCEGMFNNGHNIGSDITGWDMSNVTNMAFMFADCRAFNQDISGWDVSNVTQMHSMFWAAYKFNQDLSTWCVSNILSYPNGFASEANAWTLPKPVWGTCPAPVREPVGDTFEFTVMSEDTTDGAKPLVMNLGMGDDTWQLTVDGTVIASPTSTSEGITVENLYGDRVITISNLRARTVNYVLTLKSSMLQLGDKNYTIAANNRAISITKFSDTVDLYKFNLDNTGLTVPNSIPTTLTTLGEMFAHCKTFNDPAVTYWNTENITNMAGTFDRCNAFNQPLYWSTHQVTTMKAMFRNCHVFDQDINNWNVGQVTDMESMFMGCKVFNQRLNDWDVSSVTTMTELFRDCKQFNKYIADWDVSKVDSFEFCFAAATAFNEDISIWNVKSARWMDYMFAGATSFNQNLSGWCVTGVDSNPPKFDDGALAWRKQRPIWGTCPLEKSPEPLDPTVFNAEFTVNKYDYRYMTKIVLDISDDSSDWEVYYNDDLVASPTVGGPDWTYVQKVGNNVTINSNTSSALVTVRGTMNNLEIKVEAYPQTEPAVKISHFSNTISSYSINTGYAPLTVPTTLPGVVNSMAMMFNGTNNIVTDITGWDTSNVTDMQYLFSGCAAFNQDIGSWNVSAVTNMEAMFYEAWKFNGNIGQWNTSNVTNMAYMFYNTHAFNQDLSGWNVSLIPTKPDSFGDQWLPDWTLPKPIWGTTGTPMV